MQNMLILLARCILVYATLPDPSHSRTKCTKQNVYRKNVCVHYLFKTVIGMVIADDFVCFCKPLCFHELIIIEPDFVQTWFVLLKTELLSCEILRSLSCKS